MKMRLFTLALLLSLTTGCYVPISGRVIDAETNAPIEGAVVLVEWTKTKGVGFTYTESAMVAETLSDKDGKFDLPGCFSPFVNEPDVTIYKKGYVAWNNLIIFPYNQKRNNFQWRSQYVVKLEKFKETYSYDDHYYFITGAAHLESESDKKQLFIKMYDAWERQKAIRERDEKQRGGGQ